MVTKLNSKSCKKLKKGKRIRKLQNFLSIKLPLSDTPKILQSHLLNSYHSQTPLQKTALNKNAPKKWMRISPAQIPNSILNSRDPGCSLNPPSPSLIVFFDSKNLSLPNRVFNLHSSSLILSNSNLLATRSRLNKAEPHSAQAKILIKHPIIPSMVQYLQSIRLLDYQTLY